MAISPPGDIVLDVARAVEPQSLEAARTALAQRAGAAAGIAFSAEMPSQTARPSLRSEATKEPNAFQRFEAMVLQTFLQNMMPSDTESVYGKGLAGDMWKSMMAEQMSVAMADRGGIGIADRILADHYVDGDRVVPAGAVSGGPARAELDTQEGLSTALVQQMERGIARDLGQDAASATGKAD